MGIPVAEILHTHTEELFILNAEGEDDVQYRFENIPFLSLSRNTLTPEKAFPSRSRQI
jgi:hypothetical protein